MKKMILAALAMAVSLPAATFTYAQYDDDIYFSSSSSAERYEPVRETVMEEWSTNANNDWDIDSYNRRSADVALSASTDDTYTQSVTSNRHQNFQFGTEQDSADDNIIHDTVYVVENYYYTDRIRRFHNSWCSYHIWNPYWDVAYWDPFYWDYCYWDPWWYVSPSFGFHYGSWYWGWNYGYYTGWYGGWYSPFYRPFPHYYGPYYGGGHGWHSLPNQGPRTNNMGGSYARNNRNGARRPGNRHYTADARRSGIEGGGASYSTRGASANRNSNMRMSNDQISRNAGTRSDSRNLTTGGTTVRSNRGENYTRSAATVANRAQANNSNARRQANGVRQNSSGRTYRSTERAASSSNSFNRSSATRSSSYRSGSSRSYNNSSSYSNSSSSSSTRSYTPSNSSSSSYSGGSYSGGRSSGSSGSFGGRSSGSSGSFGGRSGGSSGSFGGRSGGGRR